MDGDRRGISVAVLVSGGVDSAVLVAELCERFSGVFPIYIRSGLVWEEVEFAHLEDFLRRIARPELESLTVLELPVGDVYADHWATTGLGVPNEETGDDAVYLPGRNLFLVAKSAVWCQLHGIERLALGTLEANPFPDSTPRFDELLGELVRRTFGKPFGIIRPLAKLSKVEVVARGARLPLELTFSCIRPIRGTHCGRCNKCAERRRGFQGARVADKTVYADTPR